MYDNGYNQMCPKSVKVLLTAFASSAKEEINAFLFEACEKPRCS